MNLNLTNEEHEHEICHNNKEHDLKDLKFYAKIFLGIKELGLGYAIMGCGITL